MHLQPSDFVEVDFSFLPHRLSDIWRSSIISKCYHRLIQSHVPMDGIKSPAEDLGAFKLNFLHPHAVLPRETLLMVLRTLRPGEGHWLIVKALTTSERREAKKFEY